MTQVKSVMSQRARMARAIAGMEGEVLTKFSGRNRTAELTREQNLTARKMARRGATADRIAEAIGWEFTVDTLRHRLVRLGIRCGSYRPHIESWKK